MVSFALFVCASGLCVLEFGLGLLFSLDGLRVLGCCIARFLDEFGALGCRLCRLCLCCFCGTWFGAIRIWFWV